MSGLGHPDREPAQRHPASFRDPESGVLTLDGHVYRYFTARAAETFSAFLTNRLCDGLVAQGRLLRCKPVTPEAASQLAKLVPQASLFVEHPQVPFVSYPYEWPFSMLRDAALLQLELLEELGAEGYTLNDASPYNFQFDRGHPLLIDAGSVSPWEDGAPWLAYSQFCRLFLNPLLLEARRGIPFQPWLRSSLEGVDPSELMHALSLSQKLGPAVFRHVVLPAWLNGQFGSQTGVAQRAHRRAISRRAVMGFVRGLHRTVRSLKSGRAQSHWTSYEATDSYGAEALALKEAFVERAVAFARPALTWDLGANTGRFSLIAARHSGLVVAMDRDPACAETIYLRARGTGQNILPLVQDLLNPSPNQGWNERERSGLAERGPADFFLALALVHHICLGGMLPLSHFMDWLAGIAGQGIVEYVPLEDVMTQRLLAWRRGARHEYSRVLFEALLRERFQVLDSATLPGSGRVLYAVKKTPAR